MTIKKISVFCGAHLGKSPDYQIAAEQIGKMMAEKDLEVIFGGGNVGCKGEDGVDKEHDDQQYADVDDGFEILIGCNAQVVNILKRMGTHTEIFFLYDEPTTSTDMFAGLFLISWLNNKIHTRLLIL